MVLHIIHPYVIKHVRTVLTTQVRILMSVKGKRINPLLVVVLTIVQKHKHHLTLLTKPVVTHNKPTTSQANVPSPSLDTTYVTNVNSSNFPNNVLPTATLNVSYCNEQANVRAFFDTGSHRSFISPDVVKRLNLRVIKQVPVNLSTFGNDTESCMLDLVKVKIRFGKSKIPLTMLVHDSAAMGYFHSLGLVELA